MREKTIRAVFWWVVTSHVSDGEYYGKYMLKYQNVILQEDSI